MKYTLFLASEDLDLVLTLVTNLHNRHNDFTTVGIDRKTFRLQVTAKTCKPKYRNIVLNGSDCEGLKQDLNAI